jgi:preprotein translocase subunit YajC
VFRTRIELRQIGVRDETKMIGGIGICGRELCCKAYLSDFVPVSIKMAKEQNLSLNPTKISGVCGRLMCCLKNEQETYEYLNSRMPSVGDSVTTPTGMVGKVTAVNILRQSVKILVDTGEEREQQEYSVDALRFTPRRRKDVKLTEEEMKELEGLEDQAEVAEEKPQKPNRRENSRPRQDRDNNRENRENADSQRSSRENRRDNNRDNDGENNNERERSGHRNNRNRRYKKYPQEKKTESNNGFKDGTTHTQP